MSSETTRRSFAAKDYDLDATLDSGQAFRWEKDKYGAWLGVVGHRVVRLRAETDTIIAETQEPTEDWSWLTEYLQLDIDLPRILKTFPSDEPMRCAIGACKGLRLLRQDPWECLASFILSSTKQIVQIRQIISFLCSRFGKSIPAPSGFAAAYSFPSAERLALANEIELRDCKMGFRAPYLLGTAKAVASREILLNRLYGLPVDAARGELMRLPGVGRKIADCVLLFAYGFQNAFPVDVWVLKALKQLYFPNRRPKLRRLHDFAATYFGPYSGFAQQYLFHYARTKAILPRAKKPKRRPQRSTSKGKVQSMTHEPLIRRSLGPQSFSR